MRASLLALAKSVYYRKDLKGNKLKLLRISGRFELVMV